MRNWIWWPIGRDQAVPTLLIVVLVLVLGTFEIPKFLAYKDFNQISAPIGRYVVYCFLLFALNFLLIYTMARASYIRGRNALLPVLATEILLAALTISVPMLLDGASQPAPAKK